MLASLAAICAMAMAEPAFAADEEAALTATITGLDANVFAAYNACDLKTFGHYFSTDIEFYHDKGGATFDRQTVVANTRKYICYKVRRELIPGTLHVYPIKSFGAIAEGEHRFCRIGGSCEGAAKFLIIWRQARGRWQMTRVVSYGHWALTKGEDVPPAEKRTH